MTPDRAALARYNTGVARSAAAYHAEQNGMTPTAASTPSPSAAGAWSATPTSSDDGT